MTQYVASMRGGSVVPPTRRPWTSLQGTLTIDIFVKRDDLGKPLGTRRNKRKPLSSTARLIFGCVSTLEVLKPRLSELPTSLAPYLTRPRPLESTSQLRAVLRQPRVAAANFAWYL